LKTGILGGATLAVILTVSSFSQAQNLPDQDLVDPDARVFSIISVTGNERFRDGDILATSGLEVGQPYTEADIVAAVEALEFTGEFRNVRVFSSGPTLTIDVVEEPDYSGDLTFGLGADSDVGVFGSVGLSLENILGGNALKSDLTFSKEVVIGRATLSGDTFWPGERAGGVRVEFADFDYDDTLFDFQTALLQPYVNFGADTEGFAGELRFSALWTDMSSIDAAASAIIQAEEGRRFVAGPGVALNWQGTNGTPWTAGASIDVYGGDAEFAEVTLAFATRMPITDWSSLRVRGRLGAVEAFGNSSTTAADRLTLGGTSMRGFSRGGISPVDIEGAVTTTLGGERYAVLQTDLLLPNLSDRLPFTPGLYFDIGSVWDVDSATAPSGNLSDDVVWRSSAGLAITAETPLGDFSASYAITTNAEDFDETERFTLSFVSEF
jgi:outer membrane protein assembly factor BamA